MLSVVMIDTRPRSRNAMTQMFEALLKDSGSNQEFLPQVSARSLSLEEMHFRAAPDVCFIGEHIIIHEQDKIRLIRKTFPQAILVACISSELASVHHIEHIARLGIDDLITHSIEKASFHQKLMLYAGKRETVNSQGRLILIDSGKGGAGVSSITAALAEAAWKEGKKSIAIDTDADTQDMSRFMRVKPYVNESLQLLLEKRRPVTDERVAECCLPVSGSDGEYMLMPVAPGLYELLSDTATRQVFHHVMYHTLQQFDVVFIDLSGADTFLRRFFYQRASLLLLVIENELCAASAAYSRIQYSRTVLPRKSKSLLCVNARNPRGESAGFLTKELGSCVSEGTEQWFSSHIPYGRKLSEWPGSGATMAHFDRGVRKAIENLWRQIDSCSVTQPIEGILHENCHSISRDVSVETDLQPRPLMLGV